jgi:hypothetical protein
MAVLIEVPLLAVLIAAIFFALYFLSRTRANLVAAILWLAYVPYEYAMKLRLLCTGECNIRVDLLLIYPVLLAASLVGIAALFLRRRRSGA